MTNERAPQSNHRSVSLRAAVLVTVLVVSAGCQGDFGDAPDGGATGYPAPFAQTGSFPTLASSGGAVAHDVSQATLGPTASIENDADDPADPDGTPNLGPVNTDSDDGIVDFNLILTSTPPPASMSVNVTGPPGSSGGTFWVNVLIDLNMDGSWGGVIGPGLVEWAVRNFPVIVSDGVSTQVRLPSFVFGNGNRLPDGAWMRIVLSREFIGDPGWEGGGDFEVGEVEDHVIRLPVIDPGKTVIPIMRCPAAGPPVVVVPAGANQVDFSCSINNNGPNAGTVQYLLDRRTGLVTVQSRPIADCPPPAPNVAGPGPFVSCGPTAIAAGPPPLGLALPQLIVDFTANINNSPLPSRWGYAAMPVDPPSVVTPTGVTVGFGDSVGTFEFVGQAPEETAETERSGQAER